jgi:transcriptional regulator with XRE-family HTH domain
VTETGIQTHRTGAGRLREERQRQRLTLRDLAHFTGCSHATIQRLEAGTIDVSASLKARIARVLRVPVAELWPLDGPGP